MLQDNRHAHIVSDVAERAAADIRQKADAEAARRLEDARRHADAIVADHRRAMAELSKATAQHVEVVRSRTIRLRHTLGETIERARSQAPMPLQEHHEQPQPRFPEAEQPPPPPGPAPPVAPTAQPAGYSAPPPAASPPPVAPPPPVVEYAPPPTEAPPPPPATPPPPAPVVEHWPPPASAPLPPPAPPSPAVEHWPPPTEAGAPPVAYPPPAVEPGAAQPAAPSGQASSEIRALAAQMAAAGSERADIERRLLDRYGIGDAGPIADDALRHFGQ
ncbi:MAG TPA: hypothetical protein VEK39_13300 [Solirubrobacterales bacterium]|nr:hypothetical protein [Solirubrobacterales bacterium]